MITVTSLIAIVVGLGLAGVVRRIYPAFESVDEARCSLDLPVVGVVPSQAPQFPSDYAASRLWTGRLVRGCEAISAALVVGVLLLAVVNHAFAIQLVSNPIEALSGPGRWFADFL